MIEETGRVLSISEQGVLVETVRQSACNQCAAAKGCGQKMLASVGQGQRFEVLADNPRRLLLQSGDTVVLGLAESAFLKASALAYLLPLLAMIAAAAVADQSGAADGAVALAGVAGLLIGLGGTRWLTRDSGRGCQYQPQILSVSETASSTPS